MSTYSKKKKKNSCKIKAGSVFECHECILTPYSAVAAASDDIEGSADGGKQGCCVVSLGWALLTW